ncbi:MAG: 30S ribosome-binding factor RbfA [Clostridiales Family XIII bacterium]|jgi:phosphoesterase RecJ-like protein|nr:30S ribosome-binding factor RbfA [Clostridiales Family XIII bacterium]
MRKNFRGGRIGEEIRRIISDMLLRELKDPGLSGLVSVTGVKASDDGSYAAVYVTKLVGGESGELGEDEEREMIAAFDRAKGLIRHEIGARLGLRHAPELQFKLDVSEAYGRHIEGIIKDLGLVREKPMNTFAQLFEAITDADTIRIYPHENMDADTYGTSVAVCLALRGIGKDCAVVIDEKIPDNIRFLDNGCTKNAEDADADADLAMLVDGAEKERLGSFRAALFAGAEKKMCFDHHSSSKALWDYNYIDADAAATAEIIYDFLTENAVAIGEPIAEALYTGIVTDTGKFQYANTTPKTLRIASSLIELGVRPDKISNEVYQNIRLEKMRLESAVLGTLKSVADGKAVIATLSRDMLDGTGAIDEETEGMAEILRSIRGVEVSVFLRENEEGKVKASMRAKSYYDVSRLAQRFGGGGHRRAAGFTADKPLAEVVAEIADILGQTL